MLSFVRSSDIRSKENTLQSTKKFDFHFLMDFDSISVPHFTKVLVDFGFTTLLTSQVINVVFYNEREKSYKFCSEALILAWGSFTCRKSTTRDSRIYFLSEGSHTQDFYAMKKSIDPDRDRTREPRIQKRVW